MEFHNTSLSCGASGNRILQRSHSLQPEDAVHMSPSRKKLKNPGRRLTELFTGSPRPRSSSCETSLRRRTFTAGASVFGMSAIKESANSSFLNRSFSELSYSTTITKCSVFNNNNGFQTQFEKRNSTNPLPESVTGALELMEIDDLTVEEEMIQRIGTDTSLVEKNDKLSLVAESKYIKESTVESVNPSTVWIACKFAFRALIWLISLSLIVSIIALMSKNYLFYKKAQCDLKMEMKLPLRHLEKQFSHLVGQEIAVSVILNSLSYFDSHKIESPLILWMVGGTGSGKTHMINIIKQLFSSISKVFTIVPSLLSKNTINFQNDFSEILQNLDTCSYNLIVIDGLDEDRLSAQISEQLMSYIQELKPLQYATGKTIFILSGTQGSHNINQEYIKLITEGKLREDLILSDFVNVINQLTQVKMLNDKIISFIFVPFLPMEKEQIRLCIAEELSKFQETNVYVNKPDQEEFIRKVMKHLHFVPQAHPLLAETGCKRVSVLMRFLLAS